MPIPRVELGSAGYESAILAIEIYRLISPTGIEPVPKGLHTFVLPLHHGEF